MRTWTSPSDNTVYDLDRIAAVRREVTEAAGPLLQIVALIDGHWIPVYAHWRQGAVDEVHADLMWGWAGDPQ